MNPFLTFSERPRVEVKSLENTLNFLNMLFSDLKVEYRVFGSVLPAAILGKPQRKLGDIDLMLDVMNEDRLFQEFKKRVTKLNREDSGCWP
jgi:hypothetical protein